MQSQENKKALKVLQSWSNFSGWTIFVFINHDKVCFFSARTSPNFSHSPYQVKRALPEKRYLSLYYLVDMNIYTWNLPVCNSDQYIYVTGLYNFFLVLQDLIDRISSGEIMAERGL